MAESVSPAVRSEYVQIRSKPAQQLGGFLLVNVAAARAKQLRRGARPRLPEVGDVPISQAGILVSSMERIAVEEVRRGLVAFDWPKGLSAWKLVPDSPVRIYGPSEVTGIGITGTGLVAIVDRVVDAQSLRGLIDRSLGREETRSFAEFGLTQQSPLQRITSVLRTLENASRMEGRPVAGLDVTGESMLQAAAELVEDVWKNQPNPEAYRLALLAPATADSASHFELTLPTLILREGSLVADLVTGVLKVPRAVFALVLVAPSARAKSLVERLREHAFAQPAARYLRAINDVELESELRGKRCIVVFVHGLLSIDIGLFDALLSRLDGSLSNAAFAGYPHDTLAEIAANGTELAKWLEKWSVFRLPLIFVCHSRGGLVARDAITRMRQSTAELVRGIVTFGTPHEGAAFAESPTELLAVFAIVTAGRSTASVASLEDCLAYVVRRDKLKGITDLRPMTGEGSFLIGLHEREKERDPTPTLAIGGKIPAPRRLRWLLEPNLGSNHDLVVSLSSSAPATFSNRGVATCDHFSYFSDGIADDHLSGAVRYISERLRSS